jgi:hypothetical protein
MRVQATALLTLTAFILAAAPTRATEPDSSAGFVSKRVGLTAAEKAAYQLRVAKSAPDLRRAGLGADDAGHYAVLAVYSSLIIAAAVVFATSDDSKPAAPAAPPVPL